MNYDNPITLSRQTMQIIFVCKFFINQSAMIKNVIKISDI